MQSSLTNHQFTIKRLQRAGIFHLFLLQHPISIFWKLYFLLLSRQIHIKILVFRYFLPITPCGVTTDCILFSLQHSSRTSPKSSGSVSQNK